MIRRLAILTTALLATLVAWLAPGCADLNSMPTEPVEPVASRWTEVYTPLTLNDLWAVWGMDADDIWMVGSQGTILHYDGRAIVRHKLDDDWRLTDVDGCATDEVWAVGSYVALRWDGRRWSEVPMESGFSPRTVLCEAPDEVYCGGQISAPHYQWHAAIRRYTGHGWKDYILDSDDSRVTKLWRPHPDGDLFAMVRDSMMHAYRIAGGDWELQDWPGEPIDADGDLVLIETGDDDEYPSRLYRIEPDHSLTVVCEEYLGDRILQARVPLIGFQRGIQYDVGCTRRTLLESTWRMIRDIAVPERPGAGTPAIFVVGNTAMAMVGGWKLDWTIEWTKLSPVESYDFRWPMLGNGDDLFIPYVTDDSRGIFVLSESGWHVEPLGYIPDGQRFLANGDLLVWNRTWGNQVSGEIHRRDQSGAWQALPPTERNTAGVWGTSEDDVVAMTTDAEFLRLVGGEWIVQDQLGDECWWFDGTAADRLFASVRVRQLGTRLLEYDGSIWRDITVEDAASVYECYLGRHTTTLYAKFFVGGDFVSRKYRDGQWTDFPEAQRFGVNDDRMLEAADGKLYYRRDRTIYRLVPGEWKPFYEHEEWIDDFFVDPTSGAHVMVGEHLIHHHSYRPR